MTIDFSKYWYIFLIIIVLVVLIIVLSLIIVLKKKNKKIKVDDNFINNLINLLGGINNIKNVDVENGRLKIKILVIDDANLNGLKELSTSGVFITGNYIKLLFKTDSQAIKKELDKRVK